MNCLVNIWVYRPITDHLAKNHLMTEQEKEFCKEDGTVTIVFCTIAFGMGVNIKGANLVIHMGPSSDLDDYLQESGGIGQVIK